MSLWYTLAYSLPTLSLVAGAVISADQSLPASKSLVIRETGTSYRVGKIPDVYAIWPNQDSECGNIGSATGLTEIACRLTCRAFTGSNGQHCDGYTYTEANTPASSTCYYKDFTCDKSQPWIATANYDSGLEGGCTYWCGKIPDSVNYSTCYNSDGSAWQCGSLNGLGTPVSTPSSRARKLARQSTEKAGCPGHLSQCSIRKQDGMVGETMECVETDNDLNQCGGCAEAGGIDCEKIAHAVLVGCGEGKCQVLTCESGFHAKGDECIANRKSQRSVD